MKTGTQFPGARQKEMRGVVPAFGWVIRLGIRALVSMALVAGPLHAVPIDWGMFGPDLKGQLELQGILGAINRGELDVALPTIREFLKKHPDSAPGEELLGVILVLKGLTDEGLEHLERAVEIDPKQATAITKIGDVLMSRGESAQAEVQFLNAVGVDPESRHAHQRLGLLYEEQENFPKALFHLEKGIVGTPNEYVGIKINLGRVYNRFRQYRKTTEMLEPVLPLDYDSFMGQLVLGTAWLGRGEPKKALPRFEVMRAMEHPQEDVLLALGIAHREAGDIDAARGELEKALKIKPGWSSALYHLGETFLAAGQGEEAIECFRRALETAKDKNPASHRLAEVHAELGQIDEAIGIYESLRKNGVADMRTFLGLATVLQGAGRLDAAGKVLTEACQRYPEHPETHFRLGMHCALARDYGAAMDSLGRARELSPWDPRITKAVSLIRLRQGETEAAITEARALVQLVPDSLGDQFYLGTLLEMAGKNDEAAGLYEKILQADPEHVASLNNLAQLRVEEGKIEEALLLSGQAADLRPDNGAVLDTYGWVLFRHGEFEKARATLENAVRVADGKPDYRYRLAVVCEKLQLKKRALEELDLALAADGDFRHRDEAQKLADQLRGGGNPSVGRTEDVEP